MLPSGTRNRGCVVRSCFLIPATVCFCVGTALHRFAPLPAPGAALLVLLTAGAWLRLSRGRSAVPLLLAALLLAGGLRGAGVARSSLSRDQVFAWLESRDAGGAVELSGVLHAAVDRDDLEITASRASGVLDSARVLTDGGWVRLRDPVRVALYGPGSRRPRAGERWRLRGRLTARPGSATRDRGGVGLRFSGRLAEAARAPGAGDWFDLPSLLAARRGMAHLLRRGIEDAPVITAVIDAMVLGYRRALPREVQDTFRRTGTAHVFAISGLHVGILCTLLLGVLRLIQVPRILWVLPLAPLITAYALLTGGRPSALRACVMAVCYFMAPLFGRQPSVVTALAAAALLILGWDPSQLGEPGFVFSFVVVGGIVALMPLFDQVLCRWLAPHAMLPPEGRVPWTRTVARYAAGLVAVSLAAWLSSAPLTAYYFGRFSPVALLANVIAVPLAFLIILTSTLSILAGSFLSILGVILNHTNLLLVGVQVLAMRLLTAMPAADVRVPAPPLPVMILYYTVLLLVALGLRQPAGRCPGEGAGG